VTRGATTQAELFRSIQPHECLNQSWNKPGRETNAPNIVAMIKRFNQVCAYLSLCRGVA